MTPAEPFGDALEPNCCHYCVYVDGDDNADAQQRLASALEKCMACVEQHTTGHVWQRDGFALAIEAATDTEPAHLRGRSRFGENVEDEWFIVYLLMELTTQLVNLTARVWDDDGEFLLIEAAYELPRWLEPATADGRVFLRAGRTHLVPPAAVPLSPAGTRSSIRKTLTALQRAVCGDSSAHTAVCLLPPRAAWLLLQQPQMVALAAESLADATPAECRAAARLNFLLPTPSPVVAVAVRFPRCLYAQLTQRDDGTASGIGGGDGPYASLPIGTRGSALGASLALGLELLHLRSSRSRALGGHEDPATTAAPAAEWEREPRGDASWVRLRAALTSRGYFGQEREGSTKYRQLLAAAIRRYRHSAGGRAAAAAAGAPAIAMDALTEKWSRHPAVCLAAVEAAAAVAGTRSDDNDDWLRAGPRVLEGELAVREEEADAHSQRPMTRGSGGEATIQAERIIHGVRTMLAGGGGEGGVRLPRASEAAASAQARGEKNSAGALDGGAILAELRATLGLPPGGDDDNSGESESEGSSFYGDDGDNSGDSDAEDEEGTPGIAAHGRAMDDQLRETAMGSTFERRPRPAAANGDLAYDDVDENATLLRGLLASYAAQGAAAGPASTLLGAMGLRLPDDSDNRDQRRGLR